MVRAYDEETGKTLWEKRLDTPLQGVPSVYETGGREYVVVCAAAPEVSDTASQTPIHGSYVAFALPRASGHNGHPSAEPGLGPPFQASLSGNVATKMPLTRSRDAGPPSPLGRGL